MAVVAAQYIGATAIAASFKGSDLTWSAALESVSKDLSLLWDVEIESEVTKDLTLLWDVEVEATGLFTDFSEYTTGVQPSDWTEQWVTTGDWTVETDAGATGGKVLRIVTSGTARRALSWDDVTSLSDVEIVFRYRSNDDRFTPRGVVRGAGSAASEIGYYGGFQNDTDIAIGRYVNGTSTLPVGANFDMAGIADVWWITRLRVVGTTVELSTWLDTDPEPGSFQITRTDANVAGPGWIGLIAFAGAVTMDIDWIGVGLDGDTAPMA